MKAFNDSKTEEQNKDLWETPAFVFKYFDKKYNFKLDLAASDISHFCDVYLTESGLDFQAVKATLKNNSIEGESIWINPPYSDIGPWVKMAIKLSATNTVVVLLPADSSVKWFKLAFNNCIKCHLISGRLSFVDAETKLSVAGNNRGSVVFVFDKQLALFKQVDLITRDDLKREVENNE